MPDPKLQSLTYDLTAKVATATEALQGARTTVQEWRLAMETLLTRYHLAAAMLGLDKGSLSEAEMKVVTRTLESQLSYLAEFAKEIEASGEWNPAWNARAQMYAEAVGASWWHGSTHLLPLPSVPKDGTCITTPESRVTTARGLIPIKDVVVGDLVLTHRHRWRKAIHTMQNPNYDKSGAMIKGTFGNTVGFTTDHRLFTTVGWNNIIDIDNNQLSVYNIPLEGSKYHAKKFYLPNLWGSKRPKSGRVSKLWDVSQSKSTVGRLKFSRKINDFYRGSQYENAAGLCRAFRRDSMAVQSRWESLQLLLGRWSQALYLSVSVAMGSSLWGDTRGSSNPSYQRGLHRRSLREFRMHKPERTCGRASRKTTAIYPSAGIATHTRQRTKLPAMWGAFSHTYQGKEQQILLAGLLSFIYVTHISLGVRDLWERIYRKQGTWETPEILFTGLLPESTTLYDLEVEEDHSFVVEGIVAHNCQCLSNCQCRWEINQLEGEGNYDCHWRLGGTKHCQTCEVRAGEWNPLQVRGGMLQ